MNQFFKKILSPYPEPETQQKDRSGFTIETSGDRTAEFFDLSDYDVITNGYKGNPYVYAVVQKLSMLMAVVPIKVQEVIDSDKAAKYKSASWEEKVSPEGMELKEQSLQDAPDHELQQLLDNPNKEYGGFDFRKSYFINKLVTGNGYILQIPTDGDPTELWNLPPLAVTVNASNNFFDKVNNYNFSWGETGLTNIPTDAMMHSKYYNPLGSVYGLSPIAAGRKAVQSINDAEQWNASLLQNGAKPEYVIVVASGTTDEQKQNMKDRFMDEYGGPYSNTAEPLVIDEDFMKFESLGYTMKDMDWANSNLTNMRKVYDIYGVSSEIFNDPENKTMANKEQATKSMYTDRILPEVESFKDEISRWQLPKYDEDIVLTVDTSAVDALNEQMSEVIERIEKVDYWTDNEKRKATGKEEIEEDWADRVWKRSTQSPVSDMESIDIEDSAKAVYDFEDVKLNGQ